MRLINDVIFQLFGGKAALEINKEYLNGPGSKTLAAALQGAKVLARLQPSDLEKAIAIVTSLSYSDCSIQVWILIE